MIMTDPSTRAGARAQDEPTRGERNHNPGNVERTKIPWAGLAQDQSGDPRFCVMDTDYFGIRMLAMVLLHGFLREGRRTIGVDPAPPHASIIAAWAPPGENDTAAYERDMCRWLGCAPTDVLDVGKRIRELARGIIDQENGRCIYSDALIAAACNSALVANRLPAQPPIS